MDSVLNEKFTISSCNRSSEHFHYYLDKQSVVNVVLTFLSEDKPLLQPIATRESY